MPGLDDILALVPRHEAARMAEATRTQRELLNFYIDAHREIVERVNLTLAQAGRQRLSGQALMPVIRDKALLNFINDRIRRLNREVASTLEQSGPRISQLVYNQTPIELSALDIADRSVTAAPDPRVIETRLNYAARRIASWNRLILPELLRTLRLGIMNGETTRQLADRVSRVQTTPGYTPPIARARAHMLANTRFAVVSASNAAREDSYQRSEVTQGIKVQKMWLAAIKDCCISCAKMHGQVVDIGQDFQWQEAGLTIIPFQKRLPHPPLHPNCRCRIVPVTADVLAASDMSQILAARRTRLETLRKVA